MTGCLAAAAARFHVLLLAVVLVVVSSDGAVAGADDGFRFNLGLGAMTSGDLLSVTGDEGMTELIWKLPGTEKTFRANEFVLTLDEDLLLTTGLRFGLNDRFGVRADLAWSEVDVTAEAGVGETVILQLYDRLRFLRLGLSGEFKLYRAPSHAYLIGGLSLLDLDARGANALDQSSLVLTGGIGYRHPVAESWDLQVELKDSVYQLDTADFAPPIIPTGLTFTQEELGPQHFFELSVGVSGRL